VDREAVIRNAIALVVSMDERPSIRRVADVIAAGSKRGRGVRWTEIAAALKVLPGNTSGNSPAQSGNKTTRDGQHPGNTPATPTRARRSQRNPKLSTNGTVSNLSLPSVGIAVTEWAKAVERRTVALADRQLRTADQREMFDVACMFAIRFMARKHGTDEKQRGRAVGLCGQIRNVVTNKDHRALHDLTIKEFFGFAREVFEAAGGYLERPWDVVTWAEAPEKEHA
jgi:hypothetical protein